MYTRNNSSAEAFLISLKRKGYKLPKYLLQGIIHRSETDFINEHISALLEYVKECNKKKHITENNLYASLGDTLIQVIIHELNQENINLKKIEKMLIVAARIISFIYEGQPVTYTPAEFINEVNRMPLKYETYHLLIDFKEIYGTFIFHIRRLNSSSYQLQQKLLKVNNLFNMIFQFYNNLKLANRSLIKATKQSAKLIFN